MLGGSKIVGQKGVWSVTRLEGGTWTPAWGTFDKNRKSEEENRLPWAFLLRL